MAMLFGQKVEGNKTVPFVPGGNPHDSILHLSQASLLATAKEGKRASLLAKFGSSDAVPVCLATLTAGRQDSVPLDIFLDRYTEFSVLGDVEVHLSGYFAPPDTIPGGDEESEDDEEYTGQGEGESEEESEDGDEEGQARALGLQQMLAGLAGGNGMIGGDDSDEGSSDEDEDEVGEEDSGNEDDEGNQKPPHCVIEEIDDKEQVPVTGNKREAQQQAKQEASNKKQKVLEPSPQQQQKQQQQQQKKQAPAKDSATAGEVKTNKKNVRRWENGFEIEELALGEPNGKLAKAGRKCMLKYVGRLKANGKIFDQTQGKKPFTFRLGIGEVIKGWDLGVQGMRVGDKRRIVIPPQLGYGSTGVKGAIPPNATLEFEMELVDVK